MLLLTSNRQPYVASPMTPSLVTLKGQAQGNPDLTALYLSRKAAVLGHKLLLIINRTYIASQMTPSLLTLSDIERSNSRSLGFQSLISRKGELGPILLLTINRKPHMASSMAPLH